MSNKWEGVFLFYEWLDALEELPPKTAMTVIGNLRRFQESGVEPTPLIGAGNIIQNILVAYARRSKMASLHGQLGAEARRRNMGDGKKSLSDKTFPPRSNPSGSNEKEAFSDMLDRSQVMREMDDDESDNSSVEERLGKYRERCQQLRDQRL